MSQLFTFTITSIFIVFQAGISHSDGSFHTPASAYEPLVTVGNTCSVQITIVTVVSHSEYIQIADIHFSVMSVQTEETSVETLAEPIAQFRLDESVFDLTVITELPWIVVTGYVERQFLCQSNFYS